MKVKGCASSEDNGPCTVNFYLNFVERWMKSTK